MENTTNAKPVPGQADPQDAGTDATAKDGAAKTSEKKVDDELARPPEDRSPLT